MTMRNQNDFNSLPEFRLIAGKKYNTMHGFFIYKKNENYVFWEPYESIKCGK